MFFVAGYTLICGIIIGLAEVMGVLSDLLIWRIIAAVVMLLCIYKVVTIFIQPEPAEQSPAPPATGTKPTE